MSEFAGKRVLVVGLGVSGLSAARALLELDAKVRVTESSATPAVMKRAQQLLELGAEVETGGHDLSLIDADVAILSPGIPPSADVVQALTREGIETYSEIELAFRLAACDFIAVTGTNGKTTTTSLLASILQEGGIPTAAAGNIGWPLIDAISSVPAGGAIAVEVSSFQLAGIRHFRPTVAILLNVAEDHTDWHGSVDAYTRAKGRIVENQSPDDVFLPNALDMAAMSIAATAPSRVVPFSSETALDDGIGVDGSEVVWQGRSVLSTGDIPLQGRGGIEDVLAAAGAALEYGVDDRAVARAVKAFRPLAHRLEVIAESDGVTYIDDSKATNPHATVAAVRGLTDVVLIAGGRSKGIDLTPLASIVPPVIAVVALGEARDEVARVFDPLVPVERAESMDDAVRLAVARSVSGGSVLLSPGCASLDMYESYAARGEHFARAVRDIIQADQGEPGGGAGGNR